MLINNSKRKNRVLAKSVIVVQRIKQAITYHSRA